MKKTMWMVVPAVLLAGCASAPPPPPAAEKNPGVGSIERLDPAANALLPQDAKIEKVAGEFTFTEGPLWRSDGHLWFSDVVANVIRSVTPDGKVAVLIEQAGGKSAAPPGSFVGPNGMVTDKDGTVLVCQHTDRRISRITKDMKLEPVVEKFAGKRLNSPNDLVFRTDGSLYFTDPPFGLTKQDDDPAKEQKVNGVYRYASGKVQLLVKDLTRPNGIAFSPDEKNLYVANCDAKRAVYMKYDVAANGSVSNARVFADVTGEKGDGCPDGMKVDSLGNVYATATSSLLVFSPEGKRLASINTPETPANVAWGNDGRTLYITAKTSVYKVETSVAGAKPVYQ